MYNKYDQNTPQNNKESKMNKIKIFAALVSLTMTLTSCSNVQNSSPANEENAKETITQNAAENGNSEHTDNSEKNSDEHIKKTIEYLNELCDGNFELLKVHEINAENKPACSYAEAFFSWNKYPDEEIFVYSDDGENFYSNCMYYERKDEANEYLAEFAKQIYSGDIYAYVDVVSPSRVFEDCKLVGGEYGIEELINGVLFADVSVYTYDSKDMLGDFRKLVKLLQDKGLNVELEVSFVEGDAELSSFNHKCNIDTIGTRVMDMTGEDHLCVSCNDITDVYDNYRFTLAPTPNERPHELEEMLESYKK